MKCNEMDDNLEAAMIKTCLLFGNKATVKREFFFQKKLLVDLFLKKYDSIDSAMTYLANEMPSYAIEYTQVVSALKGLVQSGFVNLTDEGRVGITQNAEIEGTNYAANQRRNLDTLIDEIYTDISCNVPEISNSAQVKQNVKDCLEYFIQTTCLKFTFEENVKAERDHTILEQIASSNLPNDERLINQMLLSIGSVINNPSISQRQTLETMARVQITMRLMGIDPMLQNFKRSVIAKKEFVLDTDVLLYLITDNGEQSRQYQSLLTQLLNCGCKIYVPEELFDEVYDHAEASKKMYHFISPVLSNDVGQWAEFKIKNVFLESYYRKKAESDHTLSWDTFISNYFRPKEGIVFTKDVVMHNLGNHHNIHYGHFPHHFDIYSSTRLEDMENRERLFKKALTVTLQTEKAEKRDDEKNERIAKTDTKLFLNVKRLNDTERDRSGDNSSRGDFLCHKYYVLTNTFRIYTCTKDLGIDDRLFCSPEALMAFMMEAGIIQRHNLDILSLFDNPFLSYVADKCWDDVKELAETGIDFRGKSIVTLRYDLQDYLQDLLTAQPDSEIYHKVVESVEKKGYKFKEHVEYARELEKQNDELNRQNDELRKELEKIKTQLHKDRYLARVKQKKKLRK